MGLAEFPDGIFVPDSCGGSSHRDPPRNLGLGPIDEDFPGIVGVGVLLAVLGSQIILFRREPRDIARQQIKWAAFGFVTGLLLIMGGDNPGRDIPDDRAQRSPLAVS